MSKKDKIQLLITGILVIVLLYLVLFWGRNKIAATEKKRSLQKSLSVESSLDDKAKHLSALPLYERLEAETRDLKLKRDPFSQGEKLEEEFSVDSLHLAGIAWDEEEPKAIINNEIIDVGQVIGKFKVLRIHPDKVIVNDGESDFELNVYEEEEVPK